MKIVILTAFLVGGATIFGGAVGLFFGRTSRRFCDVTLSFAAGVMLAAAMLGLIIPSLEYGGKYGFVTTVVGIFLGALSVNLLDMLIPVVTKYTGLARFKEARARRVFLFVLAIALHNLPEGIAAGVGFGTGNNANGIMIATAIALQNIPEGIIVTVAMRGIGTKAFYAFMISALTGIIEICGTFIGYFAVSLSAALLPFVLAAAGGTMLYVISEEMIPETHADNNGKISTYFLLIGFCFLLVLDQIL